jgi:nucleoid-associated protein YgaU
MRTPRKERRAGTPAASPAQAQGGYLTRGRVPVEPVKSVSGDAVTIEKKDSVDLSYLEKDLDALSKVEMFHMIRKLESEPGEERKKSNRARNELSSFKVEFQKEVFALSNRLEEQKKKTGEFRDEAYQSRMDALQARQRLEEIQSRLLEMKSRFHSAYPVYYEVVKGDSLWKIASRERIYDDPYKWIEIFYANRDKLEDKDLIYPGMVLTIPRYFEMLLSEFQSESPTEWKPASPGPGPEIEGASPES